MKRSGPLRRRTPLRPGKSLERGGPLVRKTRLRAGDKPLRRRTRLRQVNPERRARLRAEQFGGPYRDWIVTLPCVVPGCRRRNIEPCHAKSRGARGKAEHLFPACGGPAGHHAEQHRIGVRTFEAKYGLDLLAIAAKLWEHQGEAIRQAPAPGIPLHASGGSGAGAEGVG